MSESVGKVLWREEGDVRRGMAVLVTAEPLDGPLVCLERTPEDSDDGENDGCGYLSLMPSEARSLAAALVAWANRVDSPKAVTVYRCDHGIGAERCPKGCNGSSVTMKTVNETITAEAKALIESQAATIRAQQEEIAAFRDQHEKLALLYQMTKTWGGRIEALEAARDREGLTADRLNAACGRIERLEEKFASPAPAAPADPGYVVEPARRSPVPPIGRVRGLLRLEVSAPLGGTINDATEKAADLASGLGVYVTFDFNGERVTCYPTCDPAKIAADVLKRMNGRPA